jgi:arylformamidase
VTTPWQRPPLNLSGDALDRQYNNRAQRPGAAFDAFVERCRSLSETARSTVKCALDVSFGPGPGDTLDVFMTDANAPAPVNIFFHGGYWRAFSKDDFSYVASGFSPEGVITIVVDYELVPSVTLNTLIEQCRRAVLWSKQHIIEYGGDPNQIYLSGHSAGAHIVAMLLSTAWPSEVGGSIKGACAMSGIFDLEPVRRSFINETLSFGDDEVAHFSPIALSPQARLPLMCAVGAEESSEFIRQNRDFSERWRSLGMDIDMRVVEDRDHFSIREDLSVPDAPMTQLMTEHLRASMR